MFERNDGMYVTLSVIILVTLVLQTDYKTVLMTYLNRTKTVNVSSFKHGQMVFDLVIFKSTEECVAVSFDFFRHSFHFSFIRTKKILWFLLWFAYCYHLLIFIVC